MRMRACVQACPALQQFLTLNGCWKKTNNADDDDDDGDVDDDDA